MKHHTKRLWESWLWSKANVSELFGDCEGWLGFGDSGEWAWGEAGSVTVSESELQYLTSLDDETFLHFLSKWSPRKQTWYFS